MEPIINTVIPQEPTTVIKQKSPVPTIILTALFCLILGVASTLAVAYYLELDFSKKVTTDTKTQPTTQTPKQEETEENTNNEEEIVAVQYESKTLGIEYWKGQGVFSTYKVLAPKTSVVTDEGTSTSPNKTLKYTDELTGDTEITFQIPHIGLQTKLAKYTKVDSKTIENLYRIQTEDGLKSTPNLFYYSNKVTLTGVCKNGTESVEAVCGLDQVSGLNVTVKNSKNDFTVADKIISTLEAVK